MLQNEIIHQSSCRHNPQQNGIVECKNCHILKVACSIMFTTNLPKTFWGDAVLMACYLINHMPCWVLEFQTPLKIISILFPTHEPSPLFPWKYSVVPHLSTFVTLPIANWNLEHLSVYLSIIPALKMVLMLLYRKMKIFCLDGCYIFLKINPFTPKIPFRGRT